MDREIDSLGALMAGAGYVCLVHSDLCPDNTQITDGRCRITDFETSGWGPIALDVARIGLALEEDRNWGTTTMRPRLLTWLSSFTGAASRTGALPRLRALAEAFREQLRLRWPDAVVPDYPALARPGAPIARRPSSWDPH